MTSLLVPKPQVLGISGDDRLHPQLRDRDTTAGAGHTYLQQPTTLELAVARGWMELLVDQDSTLMT